MQGPVGRGVPGGLGSSQAPPFTLPIRFMLVGVVCFGLFAVDLITQIHHFGDSGVLSPSVVGLTHLLTLGSLLSFVMGAVYQLSTVAFLVPVKAVRIARMNFWLYAVGILGLILSMMMWWTVGLMLFGSLAVLALYMYAGIIIASVFSSKVKGSIQWFVLSAHIYLILAVTFAWILILSFFVPQLSAVESELLATHIVLALWGFFTFLIMGFTFKLLPMFTLSHGFGVKRSNWTVGLAHAALWLFVLGVWTHQRPLLCLAAAAGAATFCLQILDLRVIVKKRLRKKVEIPIRTVVLATCVGAIGILVLILQLILHRGITGWQSVVVLYLMGCVSFTVLGYSYKIVPFLIWNERYSKRAGKEKVPLIGDLLNPAHARWIVLTFGVGVAVLTVSSEFTWLPGLVASGIVIGAALIVFCIQMLKVIELAKVWREMGTRD